MSNLIMRKRDVQMAETTYDFWKFEKQQLIGTEAMITNQETLFNNKNLNVALTDK